MSQMKCAIDEHGGRTGRARLKPRPRPHALERDLIARLSRAEGQLRGLRRMIGEQAYCIDVLQQLSAVRRALDKLGLILIKDHLGSCVADALRGSDGARGDRIGELIETLDRFLK